MIQTQSADISGEIDNELDGSVTLKVTLHGGSPAANKLTWTLADGSKIAANSALDTEDYMTSAIGVSHSNCKYEMQKLSLTDL